jgi:hypothetical protein
MRSSSLIRLGSLAAIVGGVASTVLGLLYVLQARGVALGSIENALLKGHYEKPILTTLLVGVLAGIAGMHVLQMQHYSLPPGALVSLVAFVGVAITVGQTIRRVGPHYGSGGHNLVNSRCTGSFHRRLWPGDSDHEHKGVAWVVWSGARHFGFPVLSAMLSGGIAWAFLELPWVLVGYVFFQEERVCPSVPHGCAKRMERPEPMRAMSVMRFVVLGAVGFGIDLLRDRKHHGPPTFLNVRLVCIVRNHRASLM